MIILTLTNNHSQSAGPCCFAKFVAKQRENSIAGSDYIPGEELMSLLDGSLHSEEHPRVVIDADTMLPEELLGYSFTRYENATPLSDTP